jgi:dolichol-phosphate mannosyltransferase
LNKKKLTIICCIFNELNILNKNLNFLRKQLINNKFYHEVIFVDNNSDDGSKKFLKHFKKNNTNKKIKFIFNKKNLGKGGSIKRAIKESTGNVGVIYDIDEYKLKDIKTGFNLFIKKNCSFLIGSRISRKSFFIYKKNYYGVILITKIINFLYKLNISDSASATKFFTLDRKEIFNTYTNGFNFEFELLCKFAKRGMKISEYKISYSPRTIEEGKKIKAFRDGFKILLIIILKTFL